MNEIVKLSNGKRVANFSSPHAFAYEDGTILPAVSNCEAERLKVTFHENIAENGDVELSFSLSEAVWLEMNEWQSLWGCGIVDVVVVPLPMITAIRAEFGLDWLKCSPFRAIRMENRIEKLVSITKQCL